MDVNSAIRALTDALKNTREFAELSSAYNAVSGNPTLRKQLNDFNAKQERAYSSQLTQSQAEQLINELNNDYALLSKTPQLKAYFNASDTFGELMGNAIEAVRQNIERAINN